jgi:signal transduction histidine kinase
MRAGSGIQRNILAVSEGNPSRPGRVPAGTVIDGMNVRAHRVALLVAMVYVVLGAIGYLASRPSAEAGGGALVTWWASVAVLAIAGWATSRPGPLPPAVAPWLVPAVVAPLALFPLSRVGDDATYLVAVLWPVAVLPLGLSVARLRPGSHDWVLGLTWLTAALAVGIAVAGPHLTGLQPVLIAAHFLVVTAIAWVPWLALAAGRDGRQWASAAAGPEGEVLARAALLLTCLLPALTGTALLVRWDVALALIAVLAVVLLVGARAAVRPLAWATARANLQRDLAVAVSEAERARLAADLHDGPLQSVLLLARRLGDRGDAEGAVLARDIATELRELSGDLRLPLLDDLGVGPALDWLVTRVQRVTGIELSATWEAAGRPPAAVELAAFRIAQEAVANAVRHGRPPIRISCRSAPGTLLLEVEDAGGGVDTNAVAPGPAEPGRIRAGLLGMTQRAEQIGARLSVARSPRGTLVSVEWQEAAT